MSKKILLVEDEAIIAMNEAQMLKTHGYEVVTVYNGEKSIGAVDSDPDISLILMDIDLGRGMDGTEAAQIILESHDLPIAFLSSHTEPEVVEKTEGITSYGYIVKNSGETVLLASIKMAFRLYEAHFEMKKQKENLRTALVEQEQTEEKLLEKSEELERYFTSSLDMLCIADIQGRFIRLNPEWEHVLGYPIDELTGRAFMDFVHPEDKEKTLQTLSRLDNQEEVRSFENRYRCSDGSYRWIEWRSKPIGGTIYAAARDITTRKQMENDLRESEESLYITLNSIGDAVIATDKQGKVTQMNPVAERLCGWKSGDALGKRLEEVFHIAHADTRERLNNPVEKALQTGEVVGLGAHTMLISAEGVEYQIADSAAPIRAYDGKINGVVLVFRDVTKQNEKDRQLRESEARWRFALDNAGDGLWDWNAKTNKVYFSPKWKEILGYEEHEVGDSLEEWEDRIHPDDRKQCFKDLEEHLNGNTSMYENAHRMRTKGGDYKWILDRGKVVERAEDGAPQRLIGTHFDITERRENVKSLRQMESRLQKIIDNAPFLINEIDAQGNYALVNEATCELLGISREELVGKHFKEVLPEETAAVFQQRIEQVYSTAKLMTVDDRLQLEGKEQVFRTVLFPIFQEGNKVQSVVGIGYDVGLQIKALEEKDFLMQELNHRVKNNLNMVSSLISLKDSETEYDLSDIKHQIDAIALVHEKIHQSNDIERVKVHEYIQELLETVFSSFTLQQVNIVNNIDDISMPTRNAIILGLVINEIATNAIKYGFNYDSNRDKKECFTVSLTEDKQNRQYTLTLSNTGPPFPEEISLKNPGTLGLQLISSLVDQLNGTILLQRKPYPIFTIEFPMEEDT